MGLRYLQKGKNFEILRYVFICRKAFISRGLNTTVISYFASFSTSELFSFAHDGEKSPRGQESEGSGVENDFARKRSWLDKGLCVRSYMTMIALWWLMSPRNMINCHCENHNNTSTAVFWVFSPVYISRSFFTSPTMSPKHRATSLLVWCCKPLQCWG